MQNNSLSSKDTERCRGRGYFPLFTWILQQPHAYFLVDSILLERQEKFDTVQMVKEEVLFEFPHRFVSINYSHEFLSISGCPSFTKYQVSPKKCKTLYRCCSTLKPDMFSFIKESLKCICIEIFDKFFLANTKEG